MKVGRLLCVVLVLSVSIAYGQRPPNCDVSCGGGTQPDNTGGSAIQTWTSISNQRGVGGPHVTTQLAGKSTNIEGSATFTQAWTLFDIPGRGLNLHLALYYNSLLWEFNNENRSMVYGANFDTPSPGFTLGFGGVDFSTDQAVGFITEPTGAKHLIVPTTFPNYHTTDSTYINVVYPTTAGGPAVATFKDGTRVFYQPFTVLVNGRTEFRPYQVEDTNGNFISISYADPNDLNISTITDTLGNVIQFTYDATGKMLQSVAELDASGHVFRQYSFSWIQNQTLTFNFTRRATAGLGLTPGYYTSGVNQSPNQLNLLAKMTRPDGTAVVFDYVHDLTGTNPDNPDWGIIKSIQEQSSSGTPRLTTSYLFPAASAGMLTQNPTYTQQIVNDTVNTKVWTYQSTVSSSGLVTSLVTTDPCGNTVTTTFSNNGDSLDGLPIQEQMASPQTPLGVMPYGGCPVSTARTWRIVNSTWTTDTDGSNPRPQTVSTVLEDGTSQNLVNFKAYDSFGQLADLLEYDFGAGGPGPLLREVVTSYAALPNGIVNRPSRITTLDKNAATVSRTDFNYDNYGAAGIAGLSSNPVGHDPAFSTSNTARGNLTSKTAYAAAAAGSGPVTTTFTYDAAGNRLTAQSGCCTFSQQNYSAGTQFAFPDSIVAGPANNSLSLKTQFTYNLLTGTMATVIDPNGQATNHSYDVDNRVVNTTLPDNSTISQAYDDASASPAITVSTSINSLVRTTKVSGPTISETVSNGSTVVSTKTTSNDILGRIIGVSNPFAPSDTPAYTTYTYDPLGRVTQITPPGNAGSYTDSYGIESTSIDGAAHMVQTVIATDPAGKQRKRYTDGLGLRQVDEPGEVGGQPGTGSISITGVEQSVQVQNGGGATAGTGSVSMSGTERSTSALTHAATAATGTVTINGSEQSTLSCPNTCQPPMICCAAQPWWKFNEPLAAATGTQCFTIYDSGTVSITVGAFTATTSYGNGSTGATIASALASALNASNSPVTASAGGNVVYMTSKGTGSNQNFGLSSSAATNDVADFGGPSFAGSNAGALSGGSDNGYTTMYDTGNVTMNVTINGTVYSKTSSYGQSSSAAGIATDLANKINGDSVLNKLLVANATNGVLGLTTTATGSGTADPLSVTSATTSQYFSSGSTSFPASPSGSTLTPGQNGIVYDAGTVTVSIAGFDGPNAQKTVSYSQGSTPTSVASSLAGAFNNDQFSPVNATSSGATVTLTARTMGPDTNYGVQIASATSKSSYFGQPSFGGSGTTLSGGQNPGASLAYPLSTTYFYDPMGRLLQVNQGAQQRSYAYDNLGRLTSSRIPETLNQPTTYTYTDFGAVATKTDPRGIVTTNTYDALNRIGQITYSDSTPTVTYTYGAQGASNFGAGRLINAADGGGTASFQYDQMGRTTRASRSIAGQTYTTSYSYTNGQLDTTTYPSGRTVKRTQDAIGRLGTVSSNGTNLLTIGSYNAAGQVLSQTYGNGMTAAYSYNSRLQPASLVSGSSTTPVLNLTYNYGSQNNGQIQGITDGITPSQSVSYSYDELGRLAMAQTNDLTSPNTWKLRFTYDRYGNRLSEVGEAGTANQPFNEVAVDPTSNRVIGLSYDADGDVINDGAHNYAYNANGQIAQVDGAGSFAYDAGGHRVLKNGTVYIYQEAQVIAEYAYGAAPGSPNVEYVGKLASFANGVTTYYYSDLLSIRSMADVSGHITGKQSDFPFGELVTGLQTGASTKWQFTSYESDTASGDSGLDYAQARFYASRFGRFTSPDPFSGNESSPQSLNKFAYVTNDPINLADPSGALITRVCMLRDDGSDSGFCVGAGFLDGQITFFVGNVLQSDSLQACPDNVCNRDEWVNDPEGGHWQVERFVAFASGASGFFSWFGPGALYYSADQAGEAATQYYEQQTQDDKRERDGAIYTVGGDVFSFNYTYIAPEPCSESAQACTYLASVPAPDGTTRVGDWHDHPFELGSGQFNGDRNVNMNPGETETAYVGYSLGGEYGTMKIDRGGTPTLTISILTGNPVSLLPICNLSGPAMNGISPCH
jgi:RHS repeat-associated protein